MNIKKIVISRKEIKSLYDEIGESKLALVSYKDGFISAQNIMAAHCHCLDTDDKEVEFIVKITEDGRVEYCPCVIGSTCWPQCRDW